MSAQSPLMRRRLAKINAYVEVARTLKPARLPAGPQLVRDGKAVVFDARARCLDVYVRAAGRWRKKLRLSGAAGLVPARCRAAAGALRVAYAPGAGGLRGEERLEWRFDADEREAYLVRSVTLRNAGTRAVRTRAETGCRYFPEGALSDFTFVSFKWMGRKTNLGRYPDPGKGYTSARAGNQLFFNASGGLYAGAAYLDTERDRVSETDKNGEQLFHHFALAAPCAIRPGTALSLSYAVFAGRGGESHAGRLSNLLWRLNWARDPGTHVPQTDIRSLRANAMTTWEKTALRGLASHDHFAAHFFTNFHGQFPKGTYIRDQFGCSWLSYDLLKARHYLLESRRTGDARYRRYARNIVAFYADHHFVGRSRLTYCFHTGSFTKRILPFCERTGWGAPFNPGCVDSLSTAEMIYDLLVLFEMDRGLFRSRYPARILGDVLKLQQEDGHFRRLYGADLKPKEKVGWVSQYAGGQTWVPVLLKLWKLTGNPEARAAAVRLGRRLARDLAESGLFAMGGCENDYPDYWDVDGYRTMLWAFLALYEATGEPVWREQAEAVQLLSNGMMLGYNTPIRRPGFYRDIGWRPRGMVATSFYPEPDYIRLESTATGNQSVCWVAYLLLKLYAATSRKIYADRAVCAMRQVMVYRDERSLKGSPYRENLLYTIMENNAQMDDEAGLYEEGRAQDSYSAFIDLLLYAHEALVEFGGVSVRAEPEKRHVIGLDCVDVAGAEFGRRSVRFSARNLLPRPHVTTLKVFGAPPGGQVRLLGGAKPRTARADRAGTAEFAALAFEAGAVREWRLAW